MFWNAVLGQMRHEKLRSVRRNKDLEVCFWLKRYAKVQDACGELKVLGRILRKCVQEFDFLAFRESIAHRIMSRSIDILRVLPRCHPLYSADCIPKEFNVLCQLRQYNSVSTEQSTRSSKLNDQNKNLSQYHAERIKFSPNIVFLLSKFNFHAHTESKFY